MAIYKRGNVWWYNFVFNGVRVQHSTKVENKNDARDIEKAAWTRLARGEVGLVEQKSVPQPTVEELFDGLDLDFKRRGKLSAKNQSNLKCARAAFTGTVKARSLTDAAIETYIENKTRQGLAPATINRHLLLLGQAFRLAKIPAPKIRHLSEAGNERQGFFEVDEFARFLLHIPDDLKDFCRFAYTTGWRKNEISSLTWSDIEGDVVRLRGGNAKNGESRSVVLTGDLAQIIERRRQARVVRGGLTHFVFHRAGLPIREFRKAWASACTKAGLGKMVAATDSEGRAIKIPARRQGAKPKQKMIYEGKIFHDFRRTAVRNMIRSGVPQSIAMRISGHKTASMFRRYDISSEADLREAMMSVERYHEATQQKVMSMAN